MKRFLLVLLAVVAVLVIALAIAGRVYLRSDHARREVATRLEALYGGPVEVEDADIGILGDSTLHGLRFYEPGKTGEPPLATVGTIQTDVSALDLLRGAMPKVVTLTDPAVTLRLDREGHLVTHLPETGKGETTLPAIHVEGGQVTVHQEGRPEMVVKGVHVELRPEGKRLTIAGTISDSEWGAWSLDGSIDRAVGSLTATLKTDRAGVTQDKLLRLPLVPASVWKEVEARGPTSVAFTFRHDPQAGRVNHYRVELHPDGAAVTLPTLALATKDVRGGVTVEDELVALTKASGQAFGGELEVDGTLDFRGKEEVHHLEVTAKGLDVPQVPEAWGLDERLRRLGGKLSGKADLTVRYDGAVHTSGAGKGEITGVMLGGRPTTVELRLHPTGKGFGLGQPPTKEGRGSSRLPGRTYLAALILLQAPAQEPSSSVRDVTGAVAGAARTAGGAFLDVGRKAVGSLPRGDVLKPTPASTPTTYLDVSLNLKDVDLARLVQDLQLKVPYEVSGRLTMKVQASLPVNRASDLKLYKISGTATLPTFSLSGVDMKDVTARVRYDNGVLRLEKLSGRLVGGAAPTEGTFHGTARLGVVPEGDLSADLTLTKVPLAQLMRAAGVKGEVAGAVSGSANLRVPAGKLREPAAWEGSGKLSAEDVKVEKVSVNRLNFRLSLAGDLLKLTDVKAGLYGGEVTGGADVPLRAKRAGKLDLRIEGVDAGALVRDVPAVPLRLEGKVAGTVKGTVPAAKNGERSFEADVDLSAPKLRVQGLPTEKLTGTVSYHKGVGQYHLKGGLLGGTFELDGRIPPRPADGVAPPAQPQPRQRKAEPVPPPDSHLHIRGAQLGRLGEALGARGALDELHGRIDLDLDFRLQPADYLPAGSGSVRVTRLRWGDRAIADSLRGDLLLADGEARLRNLSGEIGGGTVRGQVVLRLRDLTRSFFNVALDGADAARVLAPWPALAANVTGSIDARLRGTLGRHWTGGGNVVMTRGKVGGVEVSEWRLPLRFDVVPARGRAEIDVEEMSAQAAHGRLSGHGTLGFGSDTHTDGNLRFSGVDLRALLRPLTDSTTLGAGLASGRIDFSGSNIRTLDDVTATVDASFSQAQAFQLPVLSALVPFVARGQASSTFRSGALHGRLANGVFRVQKLSLSGNVANLFAQGNVTTAGRLNLDVTATTGVLGASSGVLRLLGLRLPAFGPVPLALLVETTNYFSSTSVHLLVTGTVRTPVVRVEPLSLLTEEAARFFLLRAGAPLP